jgi:hypothetical protein
MAFYEKLAVDFDCGWYYKLSAGKGLFNQQQNFPVILINCYTCLYLI